MQTIPFQVSAHSIGHTLPDGKLLFTQLNFTLGEHKYSLVGANGVGKTTLAKLLAGRIPPSQGSLHRSHEIYYLEQFEERTSQTVAEYLQALWESPIINESWWSDILMDIAMDSPTASLSGGQWTRVRILKALSLNYAFYIFDEPTNNLDHESRLHIQNILKRSSFSFLLISHDIEILNCVDITLELSNLGLETYGGDFDFYEEQKKIQQEAFAHSLEHARKKMKKAERELTQKVESQEKRNTYGAKQAARGGMPKILLGARKSAAENTTGKVNAQATQRAESTAAAAKELWQKEKHQQSLMLDLPLADIPSKKLIFSADQFNMILRNQQTLWAQPLSYSMYGPGRISIAGRNGSGKSTLLKALLQKSNPHVLNTLGKLTTPSLATGYLDQNYSVLQDDLSVLENVTTSSVLSIETLRNNLAHFQFTGDRVHQQVQTLSGGEKLKAALAKLLFATPTPQLIVLDEPTNNLDISSVDSLAEALALYQGALIVVTHDKRLLDKIGITDAIYLE